jgi:two-component system copper resistance phosphate regulon response regulator CusR
MAAGALFTEEFFRICSGARAAPAPYHAPGARVHLLVIEDEAKLAGALREGLCREGYEVTLARTGEEGYFVASTARFDLVILDRMLPGRDGLEILSGLRASGASLPVLMLTARDAVEDRVAGLEHGADDYLVKPFAFPELLARVRALLRRRPAEVETRLSLDELEMDVLARRVTRRGQPIDLTAREFGLLEYLLRHRRRVVSREMLARDVWQEPSRATPLDNVIDVHVARLRRKIDDPFASRLIHTVRGVGFVLREEHPE